jgi:hypothetical protein
MKIKKLNSFDGYNEEPDFKIGDWGNWNMKWPDQPPVKSKPMGRVIMPKTGIDIVFSHNDIINLLKLYHEADIKSIKMIRNPDINTGQEKSFETPFAYKLSNLIKQMEKEADEAVGKIEVVEEVVKVTETKQQMLDL